MGMLDDLRRNDPDGLHRFLWSNHLAYAASYEIKRRFGVSKLNPSRRRLPGLRVDSLPLGHWPVSDNGNKTGIPENLTVAVRFRRASFHKSRPEVLLPSVIRSGPGSRRALADATASLRRSS
jgi:hypothetical protein